TICGCVARCLNMPWPTAGSPFTARNAGITPFARRSSSSGEGVHGAESKNEPFGCRPAPEWHLLFPGGAVPRHNGAAAGADGLYRVGLSGITALEIIQHGLGVIPPAAALPQMIERADGFGIGRTHFARELPSLLGFAREAAIGEIISLRLGHVGIGFA